MNNYFSNIYSPKFLIGILISCVGLYFSFKNINFSEFSYQIKHLKLEYIFLASVILIISVWFRSLRWKYLIEDSQKIPIYSLLKNQFIGYFGNNILPLRLGEFLRAYLISKEYSISSSYIFGTIVTEKIIDLLTLIFFSFILFFSFQSSNENIIMNQFPVIVLLLIIVIAVIILSKYTNHLIEKSVMLKNFFHGINSIKKDKILLLMITSLIIWGIYWLDVFLIGKAFSLNITAIEALMLLVVVSIAFSIPSAPGGIGTFHPAAIIALGIIGKGQNEAESFAFVSHLYGYIIYTVFGAYFFMVNQFKSGSIKNVLKGRE